MSTMSERELKGRQLLSEADKKMNSFNGFMASVVGKNSSAVEEAIELYIRAANQFKMDHKWDVAAKAFLSAARLQSRTGEKHSAAETQVLAANCFKKYDPLEAINCLKKANEFYFDLNRNGFCAKHNMGIADIFDTQLHDIDSAVHHYQLAANHFKAENSIASANKCLLYIANHLALKHDYQKAIDIYEEIAKYCIESPLLKWSANNHFMRAALCHSCIDLVNGELALKRYDEWFPAFSDSREYKLIMSLLSNVENEDMKGFTQTVHNYDKISRLDNWLTTILLTIKQKYNTEDQELDMK